MDFSAFIFLAMMMMTFGYIAGNSQNFNVWKIALLGLVLIPFMIEFNLGKLHLMTMVIAFIIGYLLPYAYMLEDLRDAISDAINAIRYKDAYEEIKRKEEEVEELRRQYEQAQRETNQAKQEYERQRRQQESQNYRKSQQQQKEQKSSNSQGSGEQSKQDYQRRQQSRSQQSSGGESLKSKYLRILGLDPTKNYSYQEIKKAYRRQAMKYHPDKHHNKGERVWKEMNERFQAIKEAYDKLGVYNV